MPSTAESLASAEGANEMRAVVQREYGSPDVLRLETVDKPTLFDNGVLVRIKAASVHAGDWHLMRGSPFVVRLLYGGVWRPRIRTLGTDCSGVVEAVGGKVTQFKPGDEVFGDLSECGFGAFAEYVCAHEKALVLKPSNLGYEEAATVACSGLAALQGLRDCGHLQPGQKVLINGAAGGVGSFAVQIAKALGAEVTAVCSVDKMVVLRKLGADHVLSYDQVGLRPPEYDLVLDTAAYGALADYLKILVPGGTYVMVGGSDSRFFHAMLLGPWISRTSNHQVKCLASSPNPNDLRVLSELIESGKVRPHLDRCFTLEEVPEAIRYVEERKARGKVAIRI